MTRRDDPRTSTPGEAPPRLRIWEAACDLLDAALVLSFDPGELENACRSAGVDPAPCACVPRAQGAVAAVHRASHADDGPLARLVERQLDLVHGAAVADLAARGPDAWRAELRQRDPWAVADLPGRVWAAATSDAPGADLLRLQLRSLLSFGGLRLLGRALGAEAEG